MTASAPSRWLAALLSGLLLVAFVGTGSARATASDEIVAMDNPGSVALALRLEGYRAKLTTSDSGRPEIATGIGGTFFDIIFIGCDGGSNCSGVLFTAGFDLRRGLDLGLINDWNEGRLIGRAFVDAQCDPIVDHYIYGVGAVDAVAFVDLMEAWGAALSEFRSFIQYDDEGPGPVADCGQDDAI